MEKNYFETKIKPILLYVGTIGAIATSIGYIILMFVLIIGFLASASAETSMLFALVNAGVGFIIMQFLKTQGIDFARTIQTNAEITDKYNHYCVKTTKKPKLHSLKYFWITSVLKDIVMRVALIAITTNLIIYIVIEGSNDFNYLLLSFVNLIMFICFGLLALVKAYDFYNEKYIPFVVEKIDEFETSHKLCTATPLCEENDTQLINEEIVDDFTTNDSIKINQLTGD